MGIGGNSSVKRLEEHTRNKRPIRLPSCFVEANKLALKFSIFDSKRHSYPIGQNLKRPYCLPKGKHFSAILRVHSVKTYIQHPTLIFVRNHDTLYISNISAKVNYILFCFNRYQLKKKLVEKKIAQILYIIQRSDFIIFQNTISTCNLLGLKMIKYMKPTCMVSRISLRLYRVIR